MNKAQIVKQILPGNFFTEHEKEAFAFAPVNIALCKYWGKRDTELNLPVTSSLSIALGCKGAVVRISEQKINHDSFFVNGILIAEDSYYAQQLHAFLDLFCGKNQKTHKKRIHYKIESDINIPVAAGLASSACSYAAIIQALDKFYRWNLDKTKLSILARLGSGSACRSLWKGFVAWEKGKAADGMDCHGVPIEHVWPELRIGLLIIDPNEKAISSREAMQRTVKTSKLYKIWPMRVAKDFNNIQTAIETKDFELLGKTAEKNAVLMHATMLGAEPPIVYSRLETLEAMDKVAELRNSGVMVYFTQDAGPNLKLLFLDKDTDKVKKVFPDLEVLVPFVDHSKDEVVLVDPQDRVIGVTDKLLAHSKAHLHRAFSIFMLRNHNNSLEILLQRRSADKYHCAGLWSNTCCSHPRPGEDTVFAAQRRLQEEMGIKVDLFPIGKFQYGYEFPNGLMEYELDHVLIGQWNKGLDIIINEKEVQDYKWIEVGALEADMLKNSHKYTPWLSEALQIVLSRGEKSDS